ncbi:MAG TPA: HAMP domain-containing sensor histidine kinase [Gemmatimonadales bacterium]
MRSIRGRLAAWYAVALAATMFVFATVVYLVQRGENLVDLEARSHLIADLIAATLTQAYQARAELIVADSAGTEVLHPEVAPFLEGIPGFVVVVGRQANVLHLSAAGRSLPYGALSLLFRRAFEVDSSPEVGTVNVGSHAGEVRYYTRPISSAGPGVTGVLSGAPTAEVALGPRPVLIAMLLVSPLILLTSVFIGYLLVGRTLAPVDRIVDEVEAIQDGRSLHRRLAPATTQDELARLTNTLNAMIQRLERNFLSLRRFTADASHELKTPLTVLRSGIERAITHPDVAPEVMEVLDEVLIEVNRMAETVDALLMLARGDEGRAPLHLEELDLRDLLGEVAETAGILGEQAEVNVQVSMPADPIPLAADRGRMRQLLMNLLTNAIKYTPAGGNVVIDTAVQDGNAVVTVQDSGIGIAPGDLPHIFDRFWRADQARSRTGQRPGVGLGLAISKWIAESHGGAIQVRSRRGKGTTFVLTLPTAGTSDDAAPDVTRL